MSGIFDINMDKLDFNKIRMHTHSAALALASARVVALPAHATHAAEPVRSLWVPTGHASQLEFEASPE